jgi:hypothetical protein
MAGLRGNQAFWVAAKQTGKSTEPTKWQDKYLFTDGNISPTRQTDQLAETDSNRNAGDFFVTQTGSEGAPAAYVRTGSIHHLLEYALGTAAHEGSAEKFKHKVSSAASLPYVTLGKAQGATLFEQFNDMKCDELTLAWSTGQPGTVAASFMGRSAVRKTEEWKGEFAPPAENKDAPLNFNTAKVLIGGGETRLVSSFELTISNNLTVQQTDDSIPFDIVEGPLAVTLGFDFIVEDLKEYNKFHYGEEAGTTQKSSIYTTENLTFEFAGKDAFNSLKLVIPKTAYTEFPIEPDAGGAPVTAAVKGAAQRATEGFVQAEVLNNVEK